MLWWLCMVRGGSGGGSKKDAAVEVWRQRLSAMTVPFVVLGGSGWFWVVLGDSG